jgi:regulator of sirC expression with transglutaminase-like and TPR domain
MDLDAALSRLAKNPSTSLDVAELALLIARDEFPSLKVASYLGRLDEMADQVRLNLRGSLEDRVGGLCRFLFDELRFRGNVKHYYDPANSYLNRVLIRRVGIPITLSVVAMAVGTRAGLEVHGVGLPGHFVAKAVEGDDEVLFDPFHGGQLLTPCDCEQLVQQVTGEPFAATPESLRPTPPGLLLQRLLMNLKGAYIREGDFERAARVIGRLRQLVPQDPCEQRDLGVCLLQLGQAGRAVNLLSGYLAASPNGPDAEQVSQLLRQAQADVARWN